MLRLRKTFFIAGSCCVLACNEGGKNIETQEVPQETESAQPATLSNSSVFNGSFQNVLNAYYSLSEAFVSSNATNTAEVTTVFKDALSKLQLGELKEQDTDDIIIPTAQSYIDDIIPALDEVKDEKDIEKQRKLFQHISANVYDLARTVRYDQESIYVLHCPMAFGNQGADWISNIKEIKNPYFGDKMLKCGHVKDSLRLSSK